MSRKESGRFDTAWKAFAAQTQLAVVAEGAPLRPLLPGNATPDLTAGVPVEQAAAQIARSFGYEVVRVERIGGAVRPQPNVIALRKRYNDPRDLPGVTFEELVQSARDIARLVLAFKPRLEGTRDAGPNTKLVRDFVASLSPEQLKAAQTRGVRLAALAPFQRQWVENMALHTFLGRGLPPMTELVDPAHTLLCFQATPDAPGRKVFGYQANKGLTQPVFVPLEWPAGVLSVSVGAQPDGRTPVGEVPDPSARAQETESASSLQSVVALLRASGTAEVTFDPALSDRPMSLFGRGYAPPEQILAALAAVSGLRIITPGRGEGTERRVARRALLSARGPAELPAAIRSALPEPLLRALHDSQRGDSDGDGRRPSDPDPQAAADTLRQEAARRLQSLVGPSLERLPNGGGDGIPVASCDATERSLFALAALYPFLAALNTEMTDPAPEYITRFDEGYVTGGPYQDRGKTKLRIGFGMWDPQTNSFREQIGIADIEPAPARR